MKEKLPDFPPLFPAGSKTIPQQFRILGLSLFGVSITCILLGVGLIWFKVSTHRRLEKLEGWTLHFIEKEKAEAKPSGK